MAYDFNGTNQYLSTASAPVTQVPLTIACWVYKADITQGTNSLVQISDLQPTSNAFYLSHAVATNRIRAGVQASGGALFNAITTTGLQNNTWHHACAVFESATNRTAYVDAGSSGNNTTTLTPTGVNNVLVAAAWFGSYSYAKGIIAEVGIWNVALTAAEIASLAKGMTCDKVRPQSLVFYAPLVRDLQDVRGGLTITNNNTATVANHPRVYA